VTNGVTFEDRALTFDDGTSSQPVLARMARIPTMFKVFATRSDVPAGWEVVDGEAEVWAAWQGQ
jgi:hypothetical protein